MGGFQHWNLSAIQPSPARFKRVYKIPAPFHGDMFGEFFEWLYARRAMGATGAAGIGERPLGGRDDDS
jgi:hypothetical protein